MSGTPGSGRIPGGVRQRAAAFCERYGLRVPVLEAPMARTCPASLAIAVANAGGMGGMGALLTDPAGIASWISEFRQGEQRGVPTERLGAGSSTSAGRRGGGAHPRIPWEMGAARARECG